MICRIAIPRRLHVLVVTGFRRVWCVLRGSIPRQPTTEALIAAPREGAPFILDSVCALF
jgi:hypothetical protein